VIWVVHSGQRRAATGMLIAVIATFFAADVTGGVPVILAGIAVGGVAGFAGALAGILYANNVRLDPSLGVLGLKAFAVALVGGLDSLGGVIPGALIVAAVEVLSVRYGDPLLADVSPFLCLLAMLLVRPWGLFGTKEELERV